MRKYIFASLLILLGISFRTVWHIAPNVEFVTAATLLATAYLGKRVSLLVPLFIMAISDTIIGNSNIFIFTWSAYILIGLFDQLVLKKFKGKSIIITQTGASIFAGLFFFLWTNFGVWAFDSFRMYPHTLGGLAQAYLMGLPFLKLNLLGNLFFVSLSFIVIEGVRVLNKRRNLSFANLTDR